MTYLELLNEQSRPAKRPTGHEGLLFLPVNDDADVNQPCYQYWERDHADKKRFYVGGFAWFLSNIGMSASEFASRYKTNAVREIPERSDWHKMPFSNGLWGQEIARKQINAAAKGRPLQFHKAATIIMACELAIEEAIQDGGGFDNLSSGEEVYQRMSIIPAVWNVDDLEKEIFDELFRSGVNVMPNLEAKTGQYKKEVFEDFLSGCSTTYQTAEGFRQVLTEVIEDRPVGRVRAKPGSRHLGRSQASEREEFDKG